MKTEKLKAETLQEFIKGPAVPLSSAVVAAFNIEPNWNDDVNIEQIFRNSRMFKLAKVAREAVKQDKLTMIGENWPSIIQLDGAMKIFMNPKVQYADFEKWAQPIFPEVRRTPKPIDDLNEFEKESYLKIIFTLLDDRFKGHDISLEKSPTTAKLMNALEIKGLKLSNKPIKRIITEAFQYGLENADKDGCNFKK